MPHPVVVAAATAAATTATATIVRSSSLDSASLSGSLSDSGFVSSTPPTVDTAATSDDDGDHHLVRERERQPTTTEHVAKRARTATTMSLDTCLSSSLLRTTLAFARVAHQRLAKSSTTCHSRHSSISSSTGSPIELSSLHAKSTTQVCTISNPSLAQFSPTPRASSCLASFAPYVGFPSSDSSSSRRPGPRSRSASFIHHHAQTVHARSRPRTHSLAFRPSADDDPTSPHPDTTATSPSPFSTFWRNHPPPSLVLPSISRAHVPDFVVPINIDAPASGPSNGFLKIDGSRDGLSFRTAENGNLLIFPGTPRPSYPIGHRTAANDDDEVADSPVGDDCDGQSNSIATDCKGKQRASDFCSPLPIPSPTTRQTRVKILLPPTPVRASTSPMLKPRPAQTSGPIPPTLASIEKSSRLMRDRVHCATCAAVGVDFPRCPRCAEAWCSRDCRLARMEEVAQGKRRHVCKP